MAAMVPFMIVLVLGSSALAQSCTPTITGCSAYDPKSCECTMCATGYFLSNNSCTACSVCPEATVMFCMSNMDTVCAACNVTGCATYDGGSCQCTACVDGYFLGGGNCQRCSVCSGATRTPCLATQDTVCAACNVTGCQTYGPNCQCALCLDGNFLVTADTCQACTVCTEGYVSPCSITMDAICGGGGTGGGECRVAECATYDVSCQCTQCRDGYFLHPDGLCSACTVCSGTTVINCSISQDTVCLGGGNGCNVKGCSGYGQNCVCAQCASGYKLVGGACQSLTTSSSTGVSAPPSSFSSSNAAASAGVGASTASSTGQTAGCQIPGCGDYTSVDGDACVCAQCLVGYFLTGDSNQCQECTVCPGGAASVCTPAHDTICAEGTFNGASALTVMSTAAAGVSLALAAWLVLTN